jgi:hypothetical protein
LYCGPAPVEPLQRKELHYDWHWIWSTGTGDLGNSGVHAFDACRWFAGYEGLPPRALCVGGRFGVDDAGETPNTQFTVLDYEGAPIFIENRNLPMRPGVKETDHLLGVRQGFILQCEGGYFAGLKGGGWAYDKEGKKIKQFVGDGGAGHAANFIRAVRERNASLLNAPILQGHISSAVCHLGNLSYRLGRQADLAKARDVTTGFRHADETLGRIEEHLGVNGVDLQKNPLTVGPRMTIDLKTETIIELAGPDAPKDVTGANHLVHGSYRAPFVVPEEV